MMCLLLGPAGVGKTVLLIRLNSCSNRGSYTDVGPTPTTIPTVGTNLMNVVLGRREVTVRELGGCMAPIWHKYYKDCPGLMFMVDLANPCQISSSCVQLLEILNNENLANVPILLILNKIDSTCTMKRIEFDSIFRLQDIINNSSQKIMVYEISAKDGQGLQNITKWIQDHVKL